MQCCTADIWKSRSNILKEDPFAQSDEGQWPPKEILELREYPFLPPTHPHSPHPPTAKFVLSDEVSTSQYERMHVDLLTSITVYRLF